MARPVCRRSSRWTCLVAPVVQERGQRVAGLVPGHVGGNDGDDPPSSHLSRGQRLAVPTGHDLGQGRRPAEPRPHDGTTNRSTRLDLATNGAWPLSETDPDGGITTYVNDEAGQAATLAAPSVATRTASRAPPRSRWTPLTRIGTTPSGELTQSRDPTERHRPAYDPDGRATSTTCRPTPPPGGSTALCTGCGPELRQHRPRGRRANPATPRRPHHMCGTARAASLPPPPRTERRGPPPYTHDLLRGSASPPPAQPLAKTGGPWTGIGRQITATRRRHSTGAAIHPTTPTTPAVGPTRTSPDGV